jgi:hypothetical protein
VAELQEQVSAEKAHRMKVEQQASVAGEETKKIQVRVLP